jgi:hypothetical protein
MKIAKQSFSNLYTSEVYRELERKAVKKGFFEPTAKQVVEHAIQKKASPKEDLEATGDVTQDIGKLVEACRRKGYIKFADDIESKFVLYKQAESQLYNLNVDKIKDIEDFAHKDGDVDIVDAGDLGMVETIESAAQKILSVVKTEPTGKLAAFSAHILKTAEQPAITIKPPEGLTNILANVGNKTADSIWVETKNNIAKYKNSLQPINITFPDFKLWNNDIIKMYSKYSNIKTERIIMFLSLYTSLGAQLNDIKPIVAAIYNNPENIRGICKQLSMTDSDNYFTGVSRIELPTDTGEREDRGNTSVDRPNTYLGWWANRIKGNVGEFFAGSPTTKGQENPKSIYTKGLDQQIRVGAVENIQELAGKILIEWKKLYDDVVGPNQSKISEANTAVSNKINEFTGQIKTLNLSEDIKNANGSINPKLCYDSLKSFSDKLNGIIKTAVELQNELKTLSSENYKGLSDTVNGLTGELKSDKIAVLMQDPNGKKNVEEKIYVAPMMVKLGKVKVYLESMVDNASDEIKPKIKENIEKVDILIDLINQAKGKPFAELKVNLAQYDVDFNSIDQLLGWVNATASKMGL